MLNVPALLNSIQACLSRAKWIAHLTFHWSKGALKGFMGSCDMWLYSTSWMV